MILERNLLGIEDPSPTKSTRLGLPCPRPRKGQILRLAANTFMNPIFTFGWRKRLGGYLSWFPAGTLGTREEDTHIKAKQNASVRASCRVIDRMSAGRGGPYHLFDQPGLSSWGSELQLFRPMSSSIYEALSRCLIHVLPMDEQNSPGFPLCLCSHHGPPPQSKGPMGPQKSSCPTAFCYR